MNDLKDSLCLILFVALIPVWAMSTVASTPVIYDDLRLSSICIVAATIGALIGVAISPTSHDTPENLARRYALKFSSCLGCGLLFGPYEVSTLAEKLNCSITTDFIVAVVGGTSVLGVLVLHRLAPFAEKILGWEQITKKN